MMKLKILLYLPIRNPARSLLGKIISCLWHAYVTASNCKAESSPLSMMLSGKDKLYQILVGSTLARELVSTTGSGCFIPIDTARKVNLKSQLKVNHILRPLRRIPNTV